MSETEHRAATAEGASGHLEPGHLELGDRGRKVIYGAGAVGVLALGASFFLGRGDPQRLYSSYLVAFLYFLSVALGGLFFVLLQHITRAGWSVVVRRLAEHVAGTLPLFAVLFVPVALGAEHLYPWFDAGVMAHDDILQHKAPFLDIGRFYVRAGIYLAAWALLGWWFRRHSMAQDDSGDLHISGRLRTLSAPAMILFAVTLTFAAIDWIMTLDPHWYSTMFGVYYFSGCTVAIFSVLVLLATGLQSRGVLKELITVEHYHDLGKLLFAFTVFWAYIAFSQFMLIWYASLPEETLWFAHRWEHGWRPVSILLAVGHFGLPFFYLLRRDVKRRPRLLAAGAVWLLLMHWLDLYWLVMPAIDSAAGFHPHLLDLTTWLGVGGVFVATLGLMMRDGKLIPAGDPRLQESLAFENA